MTIWKFITRIVPLCLPARRFPSRYNRTRLYKRRTPRNTTLSSYCLTNSAEWCCIPAQFSPSMKQCGHADERGNLKSTSLGHPVRSGVGNERIDYVEFDIHWHHVGSLTVTCNRWSNSSSSISQRTHNFPKHVYRCSTGNPAIRI